MSWSDLPGAAGQVSTRGSAQRLQLEELISLKKDTISLVETVLEDVAPLLSDWWVV